MTTGPPGKVGKVATTTPPWPLGSHPFLPFLLLRTKSAVERNSVRSPCPKPNQFRSTPLSRRERGNSRIGGFGVGIRPQGGATRNRRR